MGISVKGRIFIMNAVATALREYAAIEWPILNHKARMEALFKYLNKHFDRSGGGRYALLRAKGNA